jgi:hypothetical protein
MLKSHPELAPGQGNGTQITVRELGQELERQLPEFEAKAAEREQKRTRWLEQVLPGREDLFRDQEIPEHELYQVARTMVGGVTLERAERELEQAKDQHHLAERELNNHRAQVEYRQGLERAFHVLGDLKREKRLSTHRRQAELELQAARGRFAQLEHWLNEPGQQRMISERIEELRQHDQQLMHEVRDTRNELSQLREMRHELAHCPEQRRQLKLTGRSLEAREVMRDDGLKREIGAMREQRQLREREFERRYEIERRGITPLREFRRDQRHGRDRNAADAAWARHAAEKGLGVEHIRDELLEDRGQTRQQDRQRAIERLAAREVKRAHEIGRDRGYGWSR